MSIFISIVSYLDPILPFTIREAYEKAAKPDSLHFGIIDQSPADSPYPVSPSIPSKQVSYIKIDPDQTRGCSWARSMAMSLIGRQDWFLQIDSHMMFEQDWDATLINKANALMTLTQHLRRILVRCHAINKEKTGWVPGNDAIRR